MRGLSLLEGMFLVFLALKLAGVGAVASWSFWAVTAPLWINLVVAVLAGVTAAFVGARGRR